MELPEYLEEMLGAEGIKFMESYQLLEDELYLSACGDDFLGLCLLLHKRLNSPVMMLFAEDRRNELNRFVLYCVFLNEQKRSWVVAQRDILPSSLAFASLAKEIYSASLFEREIREMFGIEPQGNPDLRSLRLHDEAWPQEAYPLRKDFVRPAEIPASHRQYQFKRVEGQGVFEVPVGPVHAGIIGPGHFRFSAAGEPIINLELRLGWTHRGIEKLLEGKTVLEAAEIFERISGDTAFAYSLAFCQCAEKIFLTDVPLRARLLRVLFLELERMYNHANDIGGIALDVGFSFPAQFSSLIKEKILQLNERLCGSRYLKGINTIGGLNADIGAGKQKLILEALVELEKDFLSLQEMLFSSVSFMERVDATGILRAKTARDLGITGLAARASGGGLDMRRASRGVYDGLSFKVIKENAGDVAARLKARCAEVGESAGIIKQCLEKLSGCEAQIKRDFSKRAGFAMGCVEAWRGPLRVWARINAQGEIARCKIVDPSFQNWEGLAYSVLGNIIPDFPLCNKSFDLSYSGNDL